MSDPDYGRFVARLPSDTEPRLSRALADVFKDLVGQVKGLSDKFVDRSVVDVRNWGVVYSGDETTKLQKAIDNTSEGEILDLGVGTITFSSVTIAKGITIQGRGPRWSILATNNTTSHSITVTTTAAVHFKDFYMAPAGITKTAGAAIRIAPSSSHNANSTFIRLTMDGFPQCVSYTSGGTFWCLECNFVNYKTYGVLVSNTDSPDTGDSTIADCVFNAGSEDSIAIYQASSGGLRVKNNKFLQGTYHYLGEYAGSTPTSILLFSGNSSENVSVANMAFNGVNPATFMLVQIRNNQFVPGTGANCIVFVDPGYDYLSEVTIGQNHFVINTDSIGISLARIAKVSIEPNDFWGHASNMTGISFSGNITKCKIAEQNMEGLTTDYTGTVPVGAVIDHVARKTTTDATVTAAALFTLPDESAWMYETKVVGRKSDTTDRAIYHREALIYRDAAGNATIQGAVQDVATPVESNAAWDATIGVSATEVRTVLTGVAATTINWTIRTSLIGAV